VLPGHRFVLELHDRKRVKYKLSWPFSSIQAGIMKSSNFLGKIQHGDEQMGIDDVL